MIFELLFFVIHLLIASVFMSGARAESLDPRVATACALDREIYLQIANQQMRQYPNSRWIEICEALREFGFSEPARILDAAPNLLMIPDVRKSYRYLESLGFEDLTKMILKFPSILGFNPDKKLKPALAAFRELGFKMPLRLIEAHPALLGYNIEKTIGPKIEALRGLGFSKPIVLLESHPPLLGLSIDETIRPKIEEFRRLGFKNPVRMLTRSPRLFGCNLERNVIPKIATLRELGFDDPIKLIEAAPSILSISIENNLRAKIRGLSELGFKNPTKMMKAFPGLASLNLEQNIIPTIAALRALGFKDPVGAIETFPSLVALHIERNVIPKIAGLRSLGFERPIEVIEKFPILLGLSFKKNIRPTVEVLTRDYGLTIEDLSNRPMILRASLRRAQDLYEYLSARGFDPRLLSKSLRAKAITSLGPHDVDAQLRRRGFATLEGQSDALTDARFWRATFSKMTCGSRLEKGPKTRSPNSSAR